MQLVSFTMIILKYTYLKSGQSDTLDRLQNIETTLYALWFEVRPHVLPMDCYGLLIFFFYVEV